MYSQIVKTIANFNKILIQFVIYPQNKRLCLRRLFSFPTLSPQWLHWLKNYNKLEKKILKLIKISNFIKNAKTRLIKTLITISLSRNYAAANYQTSQDVPWPLVPEEIINQKYSKKLEKNCKHFRKNCLNS